MSTITPLFRLEVVFKSPGRLHPNEMLRSLGFRLNTHLYENGPYLTVKVDFDSMDEAIEARDAIHKALLLHDCELLKPETPGQRQTQLLKD